MKAQLLQELNRIKAKQDMYKSIPNGNWTGVGSFELREAIYTAEKALESGEDTAIVNAYNMLKNISN